MAAPTPEPPPVAEPAIADAPEEPAEEVDESAPASPTTDEQTLADQAT